MKKIAILAIIILGFFSRFNSIVFSQEESPTQIDLEVDSVVELGSLQTEINQVSSTYRSQLENYRRLEKEYLISLDQYQKHKTLVSIEELVKSIKKAMISRNEVLTSYFMLLRLELIDAKGIEITQKNITISKIEAVIAELNGQKTDLDSITQRDQVDVISANFANLGKNYENISSEALVLLSIGKLQAVYDKAVVIDKELIKTVSQDSTLNNKSAKERALSEIDSTLRNSLIQLQNFWSDISSRREKDAVGSLKNNMNKSLNPIFSNLSQTISYFNEFLTL